jgi:hypothetical protein
VFIASTGNNPSMIVRVLLHCQSSLMDPRLCAPLDLMSWNSISKLCVLRMRLSYRSLGEAIGFIMFAYWTHPGITRTSSRLTRNTACGKVLYSIIPLSAVSGNSSPDLDPNRWVL